MSYIGKQPLVGNFVKLDTITATATTTFNLLNGGVAYYPQSANHCLVSLNGILQAPTDSFTISGSTIIFSSALTTSDVIDFIIVLGDVLNIGTPSDNTVSLAKLTATGTKDATTFLRGDNTFAVPAGGVNTPYFLAYANANKTLNETTITKVDLNTEVYDSASNFDSSTNYRFTPTTAGYYYFFAQVAIVFGTDTVSNRAYIYKNGSQLAFNSNIGWTNVHWIDYANGTTDYYELYARVDTVSNTGWAYTGSSDKETYFGAYKLIT